MIALETALLQSMEIQALGSVKTVQQIATHVQMALHAHIVQQIISFQGMPVSQTALLQSMEIQVLGSAKIVLQIAIIAQMEINA